MTDHEGQEGPALGRAPSLEELAGDWLLETAQHRMGIYDDEPDDSEEMDAVEALEDFEEIDEDAITAPIPTQPTNPSVEVSLSESVAVPTQPDEAPARRLTVTASQATLPPPKRNPIPLVVGGAVGLVLLGLVSVAVMRSGAGGADEPANPVAAKAPEPEPDTQALAATTAPKPDPHEVVVPSTNPLQIAARGDDQMRVSELRVSTVRGRGCGDAMTSFSAKEHGKIAACVTFEHSRRHKAKLIWKKNGETMRRKVKDAPASKRFSMAAPLLLGKASPGQWQVQIMVDQQELATYDFEVTP